MAERKDPLGYQASWQELLERPFYATGMLLTAEDFEAEQNYHRSRLARALGELHGYGTAAGLEVRYQQDQPTNPGDAQIEQIIVEPGLAVDRLGRVIEVPGPACLRLDRWWRSMVESADPAEVGQLKGAHKPLPVDGVSEIDVAPFVGQLQADNFRTDPINNPGEPVEDGVVVLDLFIRYAACEAGKTPAFAAGPFDATDAVQPSRLRDSYELFLVPRGEADLSQFLPVNPWAILLGEAEAKRPAELRRRVLSPRPFPAPEYAQIQEDTSAVLLARLALQAHMAQDDEAPQRPDPLPAIAVYVNNLIRPFLFSPIAVAVLTGF
jgi:hypothetical protein